MTSPTTSLSLLIANRSSLVITRADRNYAFLSLFEINFVDVFNNDWFS